MRIYSAPALAALQAGSLPKALLVEMDLTAPLNLNTASLDLVIGGTTYYGTKGLGKVEAWTEASGEVRGLKFELSGVSQTMLALAMAEPIQGKAVRIKQVLFDPSTYQPIDTRLRWAGMLDVMETEESQETCIINVSAEHAGIDLTRPNTVLYSHADQQLIDSGDMFFQFLADQVEQRIVWPSAEFFRQ
jgi:hypothetical protein